MDLWVLPPTLAPAAYSHDSVAKQCLRNCKCAILVPFCEAVSTVNYDLRA